MKFNYDKAWRYYMIVLVVLIMVIFSCTVITKFNNWYELLILIPFYITGYILFTTLHEK